MAEKVFGFDMNSGHMDSMLKEELELSLVNGYLPCAVAFQIASKLKVSLKQVGDRANELSIRIISCQLGCFQLEKATHNDIDSIHVKRTLAEEIEASLVNGYLPCAVAFEVARKLKVTPKEVGDAATKQKTRIISCQLGCFL